MLLEPALRGFLTGGSLIIAIGAQNAFILERGLARNHVFALCLICAVSDAMLIAAGVAGLGTVISAHPGLLTAVTLGGAAFLTCYAFVAARRALSPTAMSVRGGRVMTLRQAAATCLALTFLNPHVYLDTVILLGSLSARYATGDARLVYGLGAASASFVWFFSLGYGARLLTLIFARPAAWRILDALIAAVMLLLAASLLASLV